MSEAMVALFISRATRLPGELHLTRCGWSSCTQDHDLASGNDESRLYCHLQLVK